MTISTAAARMSPLVRKGKTFGIVEDDEIDIARIVQLEGAVFAHGEHGQAGGGFEPCRIGFGKTGAQGSFAQQEAQRARDAGIGEIAQRARDRGQIPQPGNIGERNGERGAALGLAQRRHRDLLVFGQGNGARRRHDVVQHGAGAAFGQRGKEIALAQRLPRQERAVAERRRKHGAGCRRRSEAGLALGQILQRAGGAGRIVRLRQGGMGGESVGHDAVLPPRCEEVDDADQLRGVGRGDCGSGWARREPRAKISVALRPGWLSASSKRASCRRATA